MVIINGIIRSMRIFCILSLVSGKKTVTKIRHTLKAWPCSHAFPSIPFTDIRRYGFPYLLPLYIIMNYRNMLSTCSNRFTGEFLQVPALQTSPLVLFLPQNNSKNFPAFLSGNIYFALFTSPTMLNIKSSSFIIMQEINISCCWICLSQLHWYPSTSLKICQ